MTATEIAELLELGYEPRNVEVKDPGSWKEDPDLTARVIRAMLGMANLRDGGRVVIGISDTGGALASVGLSDDKLATWIRDHIADFVTHYADPMIDFDVRLLSYNGVNLVVIHIAEFEEFPILCKRERHDSKNRVVLRRGACYVRTRGKAQTIEVPDHQHMRDIIELATAKGMRKTFQMTRRSGIDLRRTAPLADESRFSDQIRGFFGDSSE